MVKFLCDRAIDDRHTQNMPKSELETVYTNLIGDLQNAINLLPEQTYKEAGGHATKSAAKALKARVLVFHAYGRRWQYPEP